MHRDVGIDNAGQFFCKRCGSTTNKSGIPFATEHQATGHLAQCRGVNGVLEDIAGQGETPTPYPLPPTPSRTRIMHARDLPSTPYPLPPTPPLGSDSLTRQVQTLQSQVEANRKHVFNHVQHLGAAQAPRTFKWEHIIAGVVIGALVGWVAHAAMTGPDGQGLSGANIDVGKIAQRAGERGVTKLIDRAMR